MPYVVDYDESGREILVPAITFPSRPFTGRMALSQLKPGDVLVWFSSTDKRSKAHDLIREFTHGAYSHAGIYLGNGMSIDAGPRGISECSLDDLLEQFEVANVMRWEDIDQQRITVATDFARKCIGYKYASFDAKMLPIRRRANQRRVTAQRKSTLTDLLGFMLLKWRKFFPPTKSIYCSQLIVEAYHAAGLFDADSVSGAFMSPNDLITAQAFTYMGFLSVKEAPKWHHMDVNAPISRRTIRQWP